MRRVYWARSTRLPQQRKALRPKEKGAWGPFLSKQSLLAGGQAEKLEPQPQVLVAFGFLMTNCAPCKSSL